MLAREGAQSYMCTTYLPSSVSACWGKYSLCVEGITTLTIVNRSRNLHSCQSAPLLAFAGTEDGDVSDEIQTDVSRLDPKPCVVGGQTPYGAGAPPQKPPSSCG